ncbi:hypothetical protein C1H46_009653 [Malus baccata]|uniref:Uncharacterized protein n=1 Tax=Malus baccata TaxID=106549 RepID=A0A540N2P9_MALBA|nr:hypothetical protein C1H46_009653 [Malus baccata]
MEEERGRKAAQSKRKRREKDQSEEEEEMRGRERRVRQRIMDPSPKPCDLIWLKTMEPLVPQAKFHQINPSHHLKTIPRPPLIHFYLLIGGF